MNTQSPTAPVPTADPIEEVRSRLGVALAEAAANRLDQLERLPLAEDDQVTAVQRSALQQTLGEITAAQQRIAEGTFGTCTACAEPISLDRLEFRPWSATCVGCAGR